MNNNSSPLPNSAALEPRALTPEELAIVAGGPTIDNQTTSTPLAPVDARPLTASELSAVSGGPTITNEPDAAPLPPVSPTP